MKTEKILLGLLVPIARFAMAHGVRYTAVTRLLKTAFVEAAQTHFAVSERRMTASRLSLLTGIRRGDLTAQKEVELMSNPDVLASLMAEWHDMGVDELSVPEVEALIRDINQDKHPKTVTEEALRAGLIGRSKTGYCRLRRGAAGGKKTEDVMAKLTKKMAADIEKCLR